MKYQGRVKVSGFTRCIDGVCQIKASEKTEVKYMQSWEEQDTDKTGRYCRG